MPATVLPPRRTVPRPVPRDRREEERAPTPPPPPSPIREISPTFSILDGHEADGSFSGATPSCVKLARANVETLDWDQIRRILAPHHRRTHHSPRNARGSEAQVRPPSRRTDPTGLFELLTQPYVELPPPPPTPKPCIRPSIGPPSHTPNHPRPRRLPEYDVDEDELPDPDADLPEQIHYEIAYVPNGKYAWAAGQPASKLRVLTHLHSALTDGDQWSTDLMFGVIGGRPTTFMSKSWSRLQAQTRFLPEFKLLSSDSYLRPLQGLVVPYVINLYDTQDTIQLFMEAPHQSFWVEASPTMSDALKQRVVDAYRKLHGTGVLHASVEKKNILIGGDGRVTLVDFSMARTKRPIKEIGLEGCTDKDLALELRKVKFILDYGHARSHETQGAEKGDRHAPKPEVWHQWTLELGQPSKRWLVPGQTQEQYAEAVSAFRADVSRLELRRAVESVSPLLVLTPESPLPVRNRLPSHVTPSMSPRKRKISHVTADTATPAKRPRVCDKEPERPVCSGPLWKYTTTSYTAGTSDLLTASESPAEAAAPPAVKVRDFASQPYDGPRGYYVPHPPTELIMSSYRAADIRNTNAIRCGRLGLPYWRGDADDDSLAPPGYIRPLPKGQGLKISLGALKRQWESVEPREEIRSAKRTRLDLAGPLNFSESWETFLEQDTRIRFDDRVSFCDPWTYQEAASEVGGNTQGQGQYDEIKDQRCTAPLSHPRHRGTPKPTRPILKVTSALRTVAWDLNAWPHPSDEEILTTPLMEQCGLLPPPGAVPSLSLPRASVPTHGTSPPPDPRTTALDLAPSLDAPADATGVVNADSEAQVFPLTPLLPCQTEWVGSAHRRALAVELQPELTPEEMEDFEAWQVETLLEPGWDPALSPQANLLAIANSEGATPYRMDTDVCRWLRLGQGTRHP
ncbi:hypothetical protein GSI_06731 [Ganoderma sinense ZZ0214-1]|uniref:Protein kinase domain-containing protein n=1 Tax=Ganoderma sinense ZZ0214-1 TaxID=1077348 RepID=A0A2G8SE94_9APHY|nr:hypothetical protein GSI_06731 [Ganoderma sinense ZZ0214-1]